jgi:hypothetical protein
MPGQENVRVRVLVENDGQPDNSDVFRLRFSYVKFGCETAE